VIIESSLPPVVVPDIPLTPFVLQHAGVRSDAAAAIDGVTGAVTSYGQLEAAIREHAGGLAGRGVGPGDVIATYAPNTPAYVTVYHAVALAGATNTTVNALYTASELAFQLRDAGARMLVTVDALAETALEAAASVGLDQVYTLDASPRAAAFSSLRGEQLAFDAVAVDPHERIVTMPYSSGTTGLAKGVMLTDHNLVANVCQVLASRPAGANDCLIAALPFFHIYGQTMLMNMALRVGASIVTMPRFDLEQFLTLIERHRVTVAYVAPPVVLALAKHQLVDRFDVSSLRFVMCGAAPLDAALQEACAARLGTVVVQGYGLTESSPVTHMVPDGLGAHPGSIGRLLGATQARVVRVDSGEDAGVGEPGELLVRGPQVMRGYLHNPDATRRTIDDEGWLHTGDIATVDGDGWFAVVDRLKELIKYKGYQVPPAELEAVLLTHPAIADACVVGRPDTDAGEVPVAFVTARTGAMLDPEDVLAFVAARVAPHKRVRAVEVIDQIPKSASGKLLRRVLAARVRASAPVD
jgi:acyl-CoA synthetase (AMP-forming)/AMP-acid ligase II